MKKRLIIIIAVLAVVATGFGITKAYFLDTETSSGNFFQAGNFDIDIDGQNPWTNTYQFADLKPGDSREINFTINNLGTHPVKIWKQIINLATDTNLQSEPECVAENGTWDRSAKTCSGMTAEDNEIDKAMDYTLRVELYHVGDVAPFSNEIIYNGNYTVNQIKNLGMLLGTIQVGDYMKVYQTYEFNTLDNKYQGDRMVFDIKISAGQLEDVSGGPVQTININELGVDIGGQYAYQHDYSGASVAFTYNTPASSKLTGTVSATGLKPYATYQIKFEGRPVCAEAGGNDTANEYIGYKGRWTCVSGIGTCAGDALARNRTDGQYAANKALAAGDPNKECIVGYLVWDFFTADASGAANKVVATENSYHVLYANGGTCDSTDNSHLGFLDPAYPTVKFCPAGDVGGQLERGTCGGMTLNSGTYDLKMTLTEESFHQGSWATVLQKNINFTIN
jgi:hypothetical protein